MKYGGIEIPNLEQRKSVNGTIRLYWRAPRPAVEQRFEPSLVRIEETDPKEVAALCARLHAEALEWIAARVGVSVQFKKDPTWADLTRAYMSNDDSPYHSVKYNTRKTYKFDLDALDGLIGHVKMNAMNLAFFKKLYSGIRHRGDGLDHVTQAHRSISMMRRVLSYGIASEIKGCSRLAEILHNTRFEQPTRRDVAMTREHVEAFVAKAVELNRPSLAISTALQFETSLRQRDTVGEWVPLDGKSPTSNFVIGRAEWANGLTWANIDNQWRLSKRTTKTGRVVSHDLTLCPIAFKLLVNTPENDRIGPVIIDERAGRPYAANAFQEQWRKVANLAGIPKEVRNMDARAGAASEADEAGASLDDVRSMMGHSDAKTTLRYIRNSGLAQSRRAATARLNLKNK
ncbi:MAG: integrase [Methylocystaceae bacterium]|nr:integrase [Methylocystaceae bacterium]NBT96980.1 integrase [Methylocystaceae bacterium]